MKLISFRIRNFRSIVDTGWQNLSPDNITCLIGQNESGKKSVLEALNVFHTGSISEDVLRSDLTLPEVSCRFSIQRGWLLSMAENAGAELKELLARTEVLELTRFWLADFTSGIRVSGEISDYLDSLEKAWKLYLDGIAEKISEISLQIACEESLIGELSEKRREVETKIRKVTGRGVRGTLFNRRSREAEKQGSELASLKDEKAAITKQVEEISNRLSERGDLITAVAAWNTLQGDLSETDKQLEEVSLKLEERHQMMTLLLKPDDNEDRSWDEVIDEYHRLRTDRERQVTELERQTALCGFLMDGLPAGEALVKVQDITGRYRSKYTGEILGRACFEHTPVFVMFEDFGSLLPNRIDLDDIVAVEGTVEGYKAARNFLKLARLDYSFFIQPSSRILKQTIENLNHKLTRNFHDFWQQSVGGQNKIRIQFELEHYSSSHGAKAGKPYLEFWIKDEGERLYPKQRSRGVRWFLSFYLELQASALSEDRSPVMLVDEPGVSLHARAQEDVLRVFEDISDRIQVIYTTHSPHLVDTGKLHRVLAVQRDDFDNYRSASRIIDPVRLASATPDTMSPVYSVMGNPFGSGFSDRKINLIVSDTGTYYFISAIIEMVDPSISCNIVPATSAATIPSLCNIMLGWGLEFRVLVFDNEEELSAARQVEATVLKSGPGIIVRINNSISYPEDLFSTIDFKRHLVRTREGITVANSAYLSDHKLPRIFLASRLLSEVRSGQLGTKDFDEESHENFRILAGRLRIMDQPED
jgi:energy-coupling factor transporter ATP-binding protein EcfA2